VNVWTICAGKTRYHDVTVSVSLTVVRVLYHDFYYSYYFAQESWDYIGSSRMVYDMDHGKFPSHPWKVTKKIKLQWKLFFMGHENLAVVMGWGQTS